MSIKCEKCFYDNRDIAKFCKNCGAKIVTSSFHLDDLVGLDNIKEQIQKIINIAQSMAKKKRCGQSIPRINLHTIIIGNTGTGKSRIGEILCRVFYKYGITTKEDALIIDAVDYAKFSKDFESNFQKAKGGILFIDNVQKLVPAGYSSELNPLDKLFTEMDKSGYDPIVILAGLPKGLKEYLNENPNIKERFKYIFELPDLNAEQLYQIAEMELKRNNFTLSDDAKDRLKKVFKYIVKTRDNSFSNARVALKHVEEIMNSYFLRVSAGDPDDNLITPDDIKGKILEEKTPEQILKELDSLVGMEDLKKEIKILINTIKVQKERAEQIGESYKLGIHIVMTGNPGTGKTTVARKLGEIFQAIGLLDRGHVVEVDRSKMVAQYVGQTAPQVNKICDSAMGGILFIDEAYTLAPEGVNDLFGKEAIDTLLKRMEDDRGKFIVIVAGYKKEMESFINANPGLKSRFNTYFHFNDYTPDELFSIFKIMCKSKKYEIDDKAEEKLRNIFSIMYQRRDKNFGNGRDVRNVFEDCIKMQSNRVSSIADDRVRRCELSLIRLEDIPPKYGVEQEVSLDESLKKLESLIGLQRVKKEIKDLANYLKVEKVRADAGGKETLLTLHFVFRGNPGTGKTTVARILADIFKSMGLLAKGHLVEVDRSGLVAEYLGQTAPKTNRVIDSAMGGVLFIDEAYTLAPEGVNDSYGKEAIDTLLKRMEDDRGKFIVIVAGYADQMQNFINSNPGLASRFTKYIDFEDYKPDELTEIFKSMVKNKGMVLGEGVEEELRRLFEDIYNKRDKNFANGRTVRNIFEMVLQRQSTRIADMISKGEVNPEILNEIKIEDISAINIGG